MKPRICLLFALLFIVSGFISAQDKGLSDDEIQKLKEQIEKELDKNKDEIDKKIKEKIDEKLKEREDEQKKENEDEFEKLMEKKRKESVEKAKKDIQTVLDEYCKALNGTDVDKIIEYYSFTDDKVKEEYKERFTKEIKDKAHSFKDFKITKIDGFSHLMVVNYSYKIKSSKTENSEWKDISDGDLFINNVDKWKIQPALKEIWSEVKPAMEKIIKQAGVYSAKAGGNLKMLLSEEWKTVDSISEEFHFDTKFLDELTYFDNNNFVMKRQKTESDEQVKDEYELKCRASLHDDKPKPVEVPPFGSITYDSKKDAWTVDYLEDVETFDIEYFIFLLNIAVDKDSEYPEGPNEDRPREPGEDFPEPPEGGEFEGPSEEELDEMLREMEKKSAEIRKVYKKYWDALKIHNLKAILDLYDLSNDEVKKEVTEHYKKLCNKKAYQYERFFIDTTYYFDDEIRIKFTYMQKSNEIGITEWEEKTGYLKFTKIDGEWKISYVTLKEKWAEARTCIGSIKNIIEVLTAKYGNDLSEVFSENWITISDIEKEKDWWQGLSFGLMYFDLEDFVIKLKEGSKSEYIIKCDASIGNGRGESKSGPEKGTLIYESDTDKWTENYDDGTKNKVEDKKKEPEVRPKDDDDE